MHVTPMSLQPPRLSHFFTHWISAFAVAVLLAFMAVVAHAAPPPAGTSISNQASASYTDGSNVPRSVTSNVVQTTVAQIASVALASNGAQNGTPGSVVYYPHTLTNTGNGSDTFVLGATSGATGFTMTNVQIFADNGSGQPTGPAITSTGQIAAGSTFKFIVVGTVPTTATSGQTNVITVTGTSSFDVTKKDTNLDTTMVTSNAVVTLTKAASVSNAAIGGPVTYTLTYTNTGNSTATAVALTDVLPVGLVYTAGTARWSVTGSTPLSDAGTSSGTAPNTLTSGYTTGTRTLLFTLAQVTAGQSGTISFNATVAAGTAPGVINNTASSSYHNGSATVGGTSNTVPVTVQQSASVTMTSPPPIGTATAGSTISFTNPVLNGGNGVDTFNIVITTSTYPAGTTFQLFKSDGLTPLVDTNGDGIIDTGPVAANTTYNVILKATLPPNAPTTLPGGAVYSVTKTGTSVVDPTKSSSSTDTLTAISGASVDLTNNAAAGVAGALGVGPGPETSAVLTQTTNPGTTSTFVLVAKNTGSSPDNYNLSVSQQSNFGSAVLPAGWTVTFKASVGGNCSTTGQNITNTGSVAAGGSTVVCAVVSVPAGSPAVTTDLYFRTLSPTSGSVDAIHDALTVNAVRSITITPNGTGQTYPGGSYVYSHTVTNTGNVIEGSGTATSTLTVGALNNQSGWTSTLYYDLNNDSQLDPLDPLINGNLVTLAPGQSIRVFNKVISPSGAVLGAVNATTITVTTTNGNYTTTVPAPSVATDSTTVIAGNLTLVKNQALDAACAGPVGSPAYAAASLSAKPGECVLYRIVVTNVGSVDATAVVVTDSVPSYTTLSSGAATTVGTVTGPAVGGTGTISANVGTLAAGAAASVTFGVKVAN